MKFRWVLSKLVGAPTLFQAFLVLLLENALPLSFHNNPYYLVAPNDHERFIYLFCTAIPFFCIFTFQDNLVRDFTSVYIPEWRDGDILFRWKGITVETSISLNFQFSSQTNFEMAKSDYHLKKIGALNVSLVSPLSDVFPHLFHLFLKYQNTHALTFRLHLLKSEHLNNSKLRIVIYRVLSLAVLKY